MTKRTDSGHPYAQITAAIVAALETSTGTFELPWHRRAADFPRNAQTGRRYRGINVLSLWASTQVHGYTCPEWASYRQWQALGAQVRRGERSTPVVFYSRPERGSADAEEGGETREVWVGRTSSVFNADQVDGWSPEGANHAEPDPVVAADAAEVFIQDTGALIRHGGESAAYSPRADVIVVPHRVDFHATRTSSATEAYYATVLHELVHWTGHHSRLGRDLSGRFGAMAYAMEELVAEFGAAFRCGDLGIAQAPREDHALYVKSWIRVLKEKERALVTATSAAGEAARYLTLLAASRAAAVVA